MTGTMNRQHSYSFKGWPANF